jgi:hypothetical protein
VGTGELETRVLEQDRWDRTAGAGQLRQGSWGQDSRDRTVAENSWDSTVETGNRERMARI